jgi:signal transduction histidine kinase
MRQSPEEAAVSALEDLRALHLATRRLCGLLDSSVLAARAAHEALALAGTDFTSLAVTEHPSLLAMRGTCQATSKPIRALKVPAGKGLGGRVLLEKRPISLADYVSDRQISHDFNPVVQAEGLHGMACVPIDDGDDLIGVLYAGIRRVGVIGDRAQTNLLEFARSVGPMITATRHAEQQTRLRISAERQRIGRELHDSLGPLLFGIGVSARKARERVGEDDVADLLVDLDDIQLQASSAASQLREALRDLAPASAECAFSSVLQMQVQPFTQRSGIPVSLVVLGPPRTLSSTVQGVLLSSVREGLYNIERHAAAASVVITLKYDDEQVTLVVQDDGRGLPRRFEIEVAPDHGRGWGLPAILGRAQALGGDVSLFNNDDGGATLRVSIPTGRGDADQH